MNCSIIIPTFNRGHHILKILDSLAEQTFKDFEVVISIDGSKDNTREVIETNKGQYTFPIQAVVHPNGGRAKARNRGAHSAKGDVLIFFDDDCLVNPNSVEYHCLFHNHHANSILNGPGLIDTNRLKNEFAKFKAEIVSDWYRQTDESVLTEGFELNGQNISIPRELFERMGGFNEELTDGEDFEFAYRAKSSMGILVYFDYRTYVMDFDDKDILSFYRRRQEANKGTSKLLEIYPALLEYRSKWFFKSKNIFHYGLLLGLRNEFFLRFTVLLSYLIPKFAHTVRQKLYAAIYTANYYLYIE